MLLVVTYERLKVHYPILVRCFLFLSSVNLFCTSAWLAWFPILFYTTIYVGISTNVPFLPRPTRHHLIKTGPR